ncbi:MAG TPA: hypothetical protein VFF89_10300 [Sphingobium sp.]|nr:hypothetical protein [Sphingobium sp.]
MSIFPRPVSPRSAFADLKLMFSPDRPHRWGLLGLSAALTFLIIWAFQIDSRLPPKEREIIYVESWMADRRDSDIIRRQIADLASYEAGLEKRQERFQRVADMVGIEWREDEAKNREQRKAIIAVVRKRLDERLAEALAHEAAQGKAPAAVKDAGAKAP